MVTVFAIFERVWSRRRRKFERTWAIVRLYSSGFLREHAARIFRFHSNSQTNRIRAVGVGKGAGFGRFYRKRGLCQTSWMGRALQVWGIKKHGTPPSGRFLLTRFSRSNSTAPHHGTAARSPPSCPHAFS